MAPTQKQVSPNTPQFIEADNQTVSQMDGWMDGWIGGVCTRTGVQLCVMQLLNEAIVSASGIIY